MAALHSHVAAVGAHPALGGGIDFKLAALPVDCSEGAVLEAGFDRLTVSLCKVRGCGGCVRPGGQTQRAHTVGGHNTRL